LVLLIFLGGIGVYKLESLDRENYVKIWQDSWKNPLREAGVPEDEIDNCMRWAIGDDYLSLQMQYTNDRWNSRHPELFVMYDSDYLHVAVYKVGEAYLGRQK